MHTRKQYTDACTHASTHTHTHKHKHPPLPPTHTSTPTPTHSVTHRSDEEALLSIHKTVVDRISIATVLAQTLQLLLLPRNHEASN